jgi:hypothetical protein
VHRGHHVLGDFTRQLLEPFATRRCHVSTIFFNINP